MKWIELKHEQPKKNHLVLCWSESDGVVADSYDMFINGEHWFKGTREEYRTDVTHWMPLPEPPKP